VLAAGQRAGDGDPRECVEANEQRAAHLRRLARAIGRLRRSTGG
jgi:hypothetical protein